MHDELSKTQQNTFNLRSIYVPPRNTLYSRLFLNEPRQSVRGATFPSGARCARRYENTDSGPRFGLELLYFARSPCSTDLDCSLNGVCSATGTCACDKPWTGAICGELKFAVTPKRALNIYNSSDPRNTWNGPIVEDPRAPGSYHIYVPIYEVGSLGGPTNILHGVSRAVTGPWDWSKPQLPCQGGENPAFVTCVGPDFATAAHCAPSPTLVGCF